MKANTPFSIPTYRLTWSCTVTDNPTAKMGSLAGGCSTGTMETGGTCSSGHCQVLQRIMKGSQMGIVYESPSCGRYLHQYEMVPSYRMAAGGQDVIRKA